MNRRPLFVLAVALAAGLAAAGDVLLLARPSAGATQAPTAPRRCLTVGPTEPNRGLVWVPSGDFAEGDTVYPEEGPVTPAHVRGFWMDRHEVTNAQFAAFVAATGYVTQAERPVDPATHRGLTADMLKPGAVVFSMPTTVDGTQDISQWWGYRPGANWRHPAGPGSTIAGHETYPVVEVTHADALAYTRWAQRALPTEAEWEWAARGGERRASMDHDQPANANTWQGVFPVINSGEDGFVGLAPSGCYPPNRYGLYDMIGNVWELTADVFKPQHNSSDDLNRAPLREENGAQYVIKGGSFLCAPNYCARYRSGSREGQEADLAASHVGFRTILRAPGPPATLPAS